MGVRRLFSRGGQNFPGGQKHTICKKPLKILFSSTMSKNILFWTVRGGGQGPPLALLCGHPWALLFFAVRI